MKRLVSALLLASLVPIALVVSCKQAEGERCQVDDDCEDPLVCAQATQTCADNQTSSGIDATVPDILDAEPTIDAAPIDGPPADSAIDAPIDLL